MDSNRGVGRVLRRGGGMTTLGDDFPKEQARVREVLGYYKEIGPAGMFGAAMIEDVLRRADKASLEGDLPAMITVYQEMKEIDA